MLNYESDIIKKYNGLGKFILLSIGEVKQSDLAQAEKTTEATFSRQLGSKMKPLVAKMLDSEIQLQGDVAALKQRETELQEELDRLKRRETELQERCNELEGNETELKAWNDHLQAKGKEAQDIIHSLQVKNTTLQSFYDKWNGQPKVFLWLSSKGASMLFLFLLAAFEVAGTYSLLLEKGVYLACAASIGLGGILMHFTAKDYLPGKAFAITYGFFVCMIYFGIVDQSLKSWLFTLTVPSVAALIAFSIRR